MKRLYWSMLRLDRRRSALLVPLVGLAILAAAYPVSAVAAAIKKVSGHQQVIIGNVTNSHVEIKQVLLTKDLPPDVLKTIKAQNDELRRTNKRLARLVADLRILTALQLYQLATAPNAPDQYVRAFEQFKKGDTELAEAVFVSLANKVAHVVSASASADPAAKKFAADIKSQEESLRQQAGAMAQVRASKPPRLAIDRSAISVSGFDSGAYMAVQYAVAYSDEIMGVGAIAGGPYACAKGSITTLVLTCSCAMAADGFPSSSCAQLPPKVYEKTLLQVPSEGSSAWIAPLANLKKQNIFLLSEGANSFITPVHSEQLKAQYMGAGVSDTRIKHVLLQAAGHGMPTLKAGGDCADSKEPFMISCQFDAAGELLSWVYGQEKPLVARDAQVKGKLMMFDQTFFSPQDNADAGLDKVGYLYIPTQCSGVRTCKLHVALHGCGQGRSYALKDSDTFAPPFVTDSGYMEWANTNDIVILFPQALDLQGHASALVSPHLFNPKGCWDWWGYAERESSIIDGPRYASRKGVQVSRLHAMISYIVGLK